MLKDASFIQKDIALFKRIGITLLMLTLTRIVFWLANLNAFYNVRFSDFFAGIWMDLITIGLFFIPIYTFTLIPLPFYYKKGYQLFLKVLFHITNSLMVALNLIDVEYFKYTGKRSTSDLYNMVVEENSMSELFLAFLVDFWWLILLFVGLIFLSNFLYNKTKFKSEKEFKLPYEIINWIVIVALLFIVGRGGLALRPVDMLYAARLSSAQKVPLVGNTPLSMIKSIGKATLKEVEYFPENSQNIYTPIHYGNTDHQQGENPNIMVIILEGFGDEWLGKKQGTNFTPFLDSLLDSSIYFENAFANGKKSIEAVPSIFAGIPSLLDAPYISSNYGTNEINALPMLLKSMGYSSGFYHGATNGSMKFDVFAAHLGFEKYIGRTQYDNEKHADGNWGILDEYFMPWTAKSITQDLQEPFLAGLFTLSSHHPYFVPEEYREILPKGYHPMGQAIAYADMSLRLFFEEAQKQPWYENTIFILTADHTPIGTSPRFMTPTSMYSIPIAIFNPKSSKGQVVSEIFNQMDIMPTILDLVGYSEDVYTFGTSYFTESSYPFAINYIQNTYLFYQDEYLLTFIDEENTEFVNYRVDTLALRDSSQYYSVLKQQMETTLKGFIQRYNHDLINNKMTLEK